MVCKRQATNRTERKGFCSTQPKVSEHPALAPPNSGKSLYCSKSVFSKCALIYLGSVGSPLNIRWSGKQ